MSERKITRIRPRKRRPLSRSQKSKWNASADALLQHASEIWKGADLFDTAVRDTIAEGLAYIVHSAFDCRAIALELRDFESINSFIDNSTAEWFRERGFAEWFCCAAGALFNCSRPRILAERLPFKIRRRRVA